MTLIAETHKYYKKLIACIYLEQELKYRFCKYKNLSNFLLKKYMKNNNKLKNKFEAKYESD